MDFKEDIRQKCMPYLSDDFSISIDLDGEFLLLGCSDRLQGLARIQVMIWKKKYFVRFLSSETNNSFIKLTFDQMSFERPFLDKVSVAFEAPWFEDELPWTSALLVQVVVLLAWGVTQAQRRCLSWKIAKRLQLRYLGKKSCRVKKLHTMILSIGQAPNLDILKKKLKVEKLKTQEKAQ